MPRLLLAALLLCTHCSLLQRTCRAGDANRPNLLLIIADDATWNDFGFTGSPEAKTPHLDKLATEGMELRQMFTPASTCSPTRHALYTGLFPIRSGAYPNHTRVYNGTRSLFQHLQSAGYRVALQGKEHVGPAASFPYEKIGGAGDDQFGATQAFITRNRQEPWFLVFASNDPHSPWNRGPQNLHDPQTLHVPKPIHDNLVTRKLLASYYSEIHKLDWQVGQLMELLAATKQVEQTLVIFVSEQGSSFPYGGKWSLYDTGIRAATIARWPGHIEPGTHSDALLQYVDIAPTFLAAAGVDPATIDTGCPDTTGNKGFDGHSFLEILKGKPVTIRDEIYAQHTTVGINGFLEPYPIRAVRDARYKYIRNLTPGNTYSIGGIHKGEPLDSWKVDAKGDPALTARIDWLFHRPGEELYDLEVDPLEQKNVASDPALQQVKARLAKQLDSWMTQQGDLGLETELKAPSRQGAGRQAAGRAQRGKSTTNEE